MYILNRYEVQVKSIQIHYQCGNQYPVPHPLDEGMEYCTVALGFAIMKSLDPSRKT